MNRNRPLHVRVPASSANLGPGFDVLGMALTLYAELGVVDEHSSDSTHQLAQGRHPALVAFRAAGGRSDIWVQSPIPSGRGLGFSGAMRVGAVALGLAEREGVIGGELQPFIQERSRAILELATELEGHADNVAASLHGGVVACVADAGEIVATKVPLARSIVSDSRIVVWIPQEQTATAESRSTLAPSVSRADAVFNLARMGQLLLALGSGDPRGLAIGVEDVLHQDQRLEVVPMSRLALDRMRTSGSIACWLSGSGPTVAALVGSDDVHAVLEALSSDDLVACGRVMSMAIDLEGLQAAR